MLKYALNLVKFIFKVSDDCDEFVVKDKHFISSKNILNEEYWNRLASFVFKGKGCCKGVSRYIGLINAVIGVGKRSLSWLFERFSMVDLRVL